MEKRAYLERATQLWIEAPYRSLRMLETMLGVLRRDTLLCVAQNLSYPNQRVLTQPISRWGLSHLEKKALCVFLISAP